MEVPDKWFQQRLLFRQDSLKVSLNALREGDSEAAVTLRETAQSLASPAARYGYQAIADRAEQVVAAAPASLADATGGLLAALEAATADLPQLSCRILFVGCDQALVAACEGDLRRLHRDILAVETGEEALAQLREQSPSAVVLSLFLPDMDGRALLTSMREDPATAALPVLLLAPGLSGPMEETLAAKADACLKGEIGPGDVTGWVRGRLHRGEEHARVARRDPQTGLPNRAAFREFFAETAAATASAGEPCALALISLKREDGSDASADEMRQLCLIVSNTTRATDTVARWNPGELALLFPGQDEFGGERAVQKVCDAVANSPLGSTDTFTSAAVVALQPGAELTAVIETAEQHLLQAESRRDGTVVTSTAAEQDHTRSVMLLTQDDLLTRVLDKLFGNAGFDVVHVGDPSPRAVDAQAGQRFQLVVIDGDIPGGGGYTVLEHLRKSTGTKSTPVIFLVSARDAQTSTARSLELGANDYIVKPLSPSDFINRVRRLLTQGKAAAPGDSTQRKLLVVGAEKKMLLSVGTVLHQHGGFTVLLALGAQDGLACYDRESPGIVLWDAAIKPADNAALARLYKAAKDGALALLMAVGEKDECHPEDALAKGAQGVVSKPLELRQLGERIEELAGIPQENRPAAKSPRHLDEQIKRIIMQPGP